MRRRAFTASALAALAAPVAAPAIAQDWPSKPLRMVIPYPPGGPSDVSTRIVMAHAAQSLGQPVIFDNKAGASGMIGADIIARSPPDGYNLLVSANSMADIPAIYGNAPYDWKTAFQPISHIQAVPAVLVVNPSSPIRTLADFVKIGRETPGKLAIADSGVGTTNHIVIELLSDATGAKYTLVHYKGSGAASIDVVAGQVPVQVDQLNSAIGHIKAGKLRAIAVSSDKRVPELPDVPTVKESGIKELGDFTYSTYTGLFGPAKMPPEVLAKLNEAMVKVLTDPATVKRFADLPAEASPSTPQELAAMLDKEDRTVVPLLKKLGVKPE